MNAAGRHPARISRHGRDQSRGARAGGRSSCGGRQEVSQKVLTRRTVGPPPSVEPDKRWPTRQFHIYFPTETPCSTNDGREVTEMHYALRAPRPGHTTERSTHTAIERWAITGAELRPAQRAHHPPGTANPRCLSRGRPTGNCLMPPAISQRKRGCAARDTSRRAVGAGRYQPALARSLRCTRP